MTVYFFIFAVAAVNLDSPFSLRDLEKLEVGANLCVYSKLKPFAFKLKEKIGLRNLSEEENFVFRTLHGSAISPLNGFIIRWTKCTRRKIEPTWTNFIKLLEEFEEKTFANELRHYLTSAPECYSSAAKETNFEEKSMLLSVLFCMFYGFILCQVASSLDPFQLFYVSS